jgi:hypothetical protein
VACRDGLRALDARHEADYAILFDERDARSAGYCALTPGVTLSRSAACAAATRAMGTR